MDNLEKPIIPGDFYEDCRYHPCVAVRVNEYEVMGISLINGKISICFPPMCPIKRLDISQVLNSKLFGPPDVRNSRYEKKWW